MARLIKETQAKLLKQSRQNKTLFVQRRVYIFLGFIELFKTKQQKMKKEARMIRYRYLVRQRV
jgi:hypothetical protein